MALIVNLDIDNISTPKGAEGKIFDYEDSLDIDYNGLEVEFGLPVLKEVKELNVIEVKFSGTNKKRSKLF